MTVFPEQRCFILLAILLCLASGSGVAAAVEKSEVRDKWHTPFDLYLSPREAYDMKSADPDGVLMIDVRTRAEAQFVGFTDMADANIPIHLYSEEWKQKSDEIHGTYRKIYNDDFVAAVDNFIASRSMDRSIPIILMCQSGGRSPYAARALYDAGYEVVYFQVEGFEGIKATTGLNKGKRVINGWKNAGLPWGFKLKTEKMYFNFAPVQP